MRKPRRKHLAAPSAVRLEAAEQLWFAVDQVLPAVVTEMLEDPCWDDTDRRRLQRQCDEVVATAAGRQVDHPRSRRELEAMQDSLHRFDRHLGEFEGAVHYALLRNLAIPVERYPYWHLRNLAIAVEQLRRVLWPTEWPRWSALDDEEVRTGLEWLHAALRGLRPLLAGTELGLVTSLLATGVPLDEAHETVGVAIGAHPSTGGKEAG